VDSVAASRVDSIAVPCSDSVAASRLDSIAVPCLDSVAQPAATAAQRPKQSSGLGPEPILHLAGMARQLEQ
jgi:hypothetical protein